MKHIHYDVIPHLMRNPVDLIMDSCFRRNDKFVLVTFYTAFRGG
jgi:hypothetical protein